jgi:opacity protein-like surface antigen
LVGFTVSAASAEVYLSGNLGAVFLTDADGDVDGYTGELTFDTGGVATFAVGTTVGNSGRIEFEIGSRVNDMDEVTSDYYNFTTDIDGDVTTLSYMGNVYFDFKNNGKFTPFIGGGLGIANVEYDVDSVNGNSRFSDKADDTVMAYQVMTGISYAATDHLNIDLQYRYFGTEDPEIDVLDTEYQSHNVMLGLRYSF